MLLQIMEEGHLSDAKGHKIDFRNAIIVMTSNIGADEIRRQTALGFTLQRDEVIEEKKSYEEMRKKLLESLKKVFRPEFVNRLDGVIVFHALSREHIKQIVSLELQKVSDRLQTHQIKINATAAAIQQLADEGYDPDMGARPLRRVIQQKVEDPLSDAVLGGGFKDGETVWVGLNEDKQIILSREKSETPDPSLAGIKT